MIPFDYRPRTRVLFGPGEFARLGEVAREQNATRCLLLADQAMLDAGYAHEAIRSLKARRMDVFAFHEFQPNPNVAMVEAACAYAAPQNVNLIVGLGGGSALDFTKAVNVVLSNGGSLRDYWGYGNVPKPLLPMLAVPTSSGTGAEMQTTASIADPQRKLTCGDPKIFFRTAILDAKLTLTQPPALTAASGYDAIAHALETLLSTRRTSLSECYSREAWRLLDANYTHVVREPDDVDARAAMLLGSHFAGMAVEYASLGPAHACAQPLVENFKLPHGVAIALVLRRALEWLGEPLERTRRLAHLAEIAELPACLRDASIPEHALPRLADEAAAQWTGRFSARTFNSAAALEIYQSAY
jgi:alcohol dehydrogenase